MTAAPTGPRKRFRCHGVSASTLVGFLLAAGILGSVIELCLEGPMQLSAAFAFGAAIVLGEAMRITLPGDRDNAPLASTAALGYALTVTLGGAPALWGPVQVIVVVAFAAIIGSLPQALGGRPPTLGYLTRRIGVTGAVAWLLRSPLHATAMNSTHTELLILLSSMACLAMLLDSAVAALFASSAPGVAQGPVSARAEFDSSAGIAFAAASLSGQVSGQYSGQAASDVLGVSPEKIALSRLAHRFFIDWLEECAAMARVLPAVAALSVAVALAADPLGLWVLPIAAAPILVMQRPLRRYAAIRATYQQTIRALSRMTDLAGYTEPGHARRVCRLALAIGRELDLSEPELLDLEYAALLHDIGQLSLADPLPGGATVLATPWVAAEVAVRGAEVVRQTGVLDGVARVLEAQYGPLTSSAAESAVDPEAEAEVEAEAAGGDSGANAKDRVSASPSELRAAAILRVANDFEDLCTAEPGPKAHINALSRIRLGIGAKYDARAVEALTRLLVAE